MRPVHKPATRLTLALRGTAAGAAMLIWASSAPLCAQEWSGAPLHTESEGGLWVAAAPAPAAPTAAAVETPLARARLALARLVETRPAQDEVAAFYRSRGDKPLWLTDAGLRPEAQDVVDQLERQGDPAAGEVRGAVGAATLDDPDSLAAAELVLSAAVAGQARLRASDDTAEGLAFVDPELEKQWGGGRAALESAAAASDLSAWLAARLGGANPLYTQLARGLERYRASWGALPDVKIAAGPVLDVGARGARVAALRQRLGLPEGGDRYDAALGEAVQAFQRAHGLETSGRVDAATLRALNAGPWAYEQQILANMERAKQLPPSFGERYILVDAGAGELWFYDHGQVAKTMKVVVGKPAMATPMMAGMVRYATFNPYWNVPEDLVRTSIAPKVLSQGLGYVEAQNFEVLSDYSDTAVVLDSAAVDWKGVADGTVTVRVRQKPGPKNMMGQVKLNFPNPLGIYLHDTPLKELFGLEQRTASSGCVRLADAMSLAELLVGAEKAHELVASGATETSTALAAPVPVFITYLTAAPTDDGFVFRPDVYGRDKAWSAKTAMAQAGGASGGH